MIKSSHRRVATGIKSCLSVKLHENCFRSSPIYFVVRSLGTKKKSKYAEYDEDLLPYLHGRKSTEREDSVTEHILNERKIHQERFQDIVVDSSLILKMNKIGLGSKKRINLSSSRHELTNSSSQNKSIGAGGFAVHLTSAASDWPVFTHVLPEIAFAGHTNSGKSTLVNTISGLSPRKGPAKVSERAGWTDQICFYQLGKRPPLFILADLPGYGHAVANPAEIKIWNVMTRDYLKNREVLSLACVLVDSTRGLCAHDTSLIKFLTKREVNWRVILTKCDLLTPVEVAKSALLVDCDLRAIVDSLRKDSSTTGSFPVSTIPIPEISLPENLPDQVSDTVDSSSSASLLDTTHTLNTDTVVGSENDNQSHMQTEVVDAPVVENEDEIDWPVYDYDCERAPALGFQYTSKSNEDNDDVYSKSNDDDENDDDGDYDAESESVNDIELGDDGNIIDQTTSNSKHNKNDKSPTTLLTYVIPVSASTGAGIRQLWDELQRVSQQSTRPISNQSLTDGNTLDSYTDSKSKDTFDGVEAAKNLMAMQKSLYGDRDLLISRSSGVSSGQMYAVREHYNAHILRKNVAQRQVQKKHRLQR